MPPHHPGKRLGPDDAVSAPKGSLRSGSSFFVRLLQPFCLYQEVLGVVAANIKFLAFLSKIHHPEGSVSAFFRCIRIPDTFFSSWRLAKFSNSWLFAWVSPQLRRSSSGSWLRFGVFLHSLGFGFGLFCTTGSFRRPPESRFSFSEDVPLVVQLSRDSRRLGDVSACGASVVISSSESYWTLLVSGLLQPGNELQALSLGSLFLSFGDLPTFLS